MEAEENRINKLISRIYNDDLIMRQVFKNIPSFKDRQLIELSSLRLYALSCQTPCQMENVLRLTICYANSSKDDMLVFIEKSSGSTFTKVSDLSFVRSRQRYMEVLELLSRRFWPEIQSIVYQDCLNQKILQAINEYFPKVDEINCTGFTADGLDYLNNTKHNLWKRIEKFGFMDFDLPSQSVQKVFKTFVSLKHIQCWIQRKWPTKLFLEELELTPQIEILSVEHLATNNRDVMNLKTFSNYFKTIRFSDPVTFNSGMLRSLIQTTNLTHLEVTLLHLTQNEVIEFFTKIKICQLKRVCLSECRYDNELLLVIRNSEIYNSKLEDMKIKCWELKGNLDLPLLSICPSSLKKLVVDDCTLFRNDLEFIEKNCQNLCDFTLIPSFNDGFVIDFECVDDVKILRLEHIYKTLKTLPKLTTFKVVELMEPEFLSTLCNEMPNIDTAHFRMQRINRDRAYNLLKLFYEKVTITQGIFTYKSFFDDISTSNEFDDFYWKEWGNAVNQARCRTLQNCSWFMEEYLTSDITDNDYTTRWNIILQNRRKNCPKEFSSLNVL